MKNSVAKRNWPIRSARSVNQNRWPNFGKKYQGPELTPTLMYTEMGIYEAYVIADRAIGDYTATWPFYSAPPGVLPVATSNSNKAGINIAAVAKP